MRPEIPDTVPVFLFLAACVFVILHLWGCMPRSSSASQMQAEAVYTGALLACVDRSATLSESKACRARVDREWGISQTATDGGAR